MNVARVRNRIEAKNNNLRIETEQVTLSLYAGWEEHRQAMLQVQAETQVLKETERKWGGGTCFSLPVDGVTQSFAFGKGRTGADKVAV